MHKLFLSSVVLFILSSSWLVVVVEADSTMWTRTYGGGDENCAFSLVATSDGGYAVAGQTESYGSGYSDAWLVKVDAAGNPEWNQTYGGTKLDGSYSLVVTSDGGYALAGYTLSFGFGNPDIVSNNFNFWLIKTDSSGKVEWNKTYGGSADERAQCIIKTSDEGYAIVGTTEDQYEDIWLVKTNATGDMLWNRTYGVIGVDEANSLIETSDGGYAIAGSTLSFVDDKIGAWLVKTNATGNMEWNQTYEEGAFYSSLVETSDKGYALTGVKYSSGAGQDGFLIKTDESGKIEWNRTYGGTENDGVCSLLVTSDKGYVMAGSTESFGVENADFWLIKTDEYGNIQWNQTYVGPKTDSAQSLVKASDGGYVIVGYTLIPGLSMSMDYGDIWMIKTDEYGVVPEFSAWMVPPLLAIATLVAIIYKRKLFNYSP